MEPRKFSKILNACLERGSLSKVKVAALSDETKAMMIHVIVRRRQPLIVNLLYPEVDMAWLYACGYLYRTAGQKFEFLHTCEHAIT